jgi:hypothetical protein
MIVIKSKILSYSISVLLITLLNANENNFSQSVTDSSQVIYIDVSSTNLPLSTLGNNSMDAKTADLDGDNDIDIVVACEYCPNIILINDGHGVFANESSTRLPQVVHDSEDIGIADFDGDGDQDIIFVSEDDQTNEFYLNNGSGYFSDFTIRIPVTGISNAVLAVDVNIDSIPDIIMGNDGQNVILINNGNAFFTNETMSRLPVNLNITQDLEWGDIDGDGDNDLLEGNENGNRILINDGSGFFNDETITRLPLPVSGEETREVDLGDVDNDGDLDIFYANVTFTQGLPSQNRLLLNDGNGFYTDVTSTNLPVSQENTVDGDFRDVDLDGDLDILTAQAFNGTYQVLLNDSTGVFTIQTDKIYFPLPQGSGVDVEEDDFNGDGLMDIYLCGFQHTDYLYLAEANLTSVKDSENEIRQKQFNLFQNYPNPFNPTTKIKFTIPAVIASGAKQSQLVTIKVYGILGNEITTLVNEEKGPGTYEVEFSAIGGSASGGNNHSGLSGIKGLTSGMYFYTLTAGSYSETRKMILLK